MFIISSILDQWFDERTKVCIDPLREVRAHFSESLRYHIKESQQEVPGSYGIDFCASRKTGQRTVYPEIYWETQFGFVLFVREASGYTPIASIGFEKKSTYLFVRQLQGVKGMKKFLCPLHWEKLLYVTVVKFARELGLKEVRVCPAEKSNYHPFGNSECARGLTLSECAQRAERLHLIYNVTPKKCGFIWDEDSRTHTYVLPE